MKLKILEWKQIWNRWSGICGLVFFPIAFPIVVFIRFMYRKRYISFKEYIKLSVDIMNTGQMK